MNLLSVADKFADLALEHVQREYPNKLDHVLNGEHDLRSPRALHPVFYGSFDWHSNVHGYWLLATLYRRVPSLPARDRIRALFDAQLTPANFQGEVAYLNEPMRSGFERPYGWAWLLMLAAELTRHKTAESRSWSVAIQPLASVFVQRFREFLPKASYPIRVGTHFNTAFAVALALEYADEVGDDALGSLLRTTATTWYANDVDCQAWEPSGDDFLSSALMEAECMRRVLPGTEWSAWFDRFLPRVAQREPRTLFEPAVVSDRTDGKIAHLDGLNLSRAWCWRLLSSAWSPDDARRAMALEAADRHVEASLPHLAGDYVGEHWLATYALLAILAEEAVASSKPQS
jgi:hypothetical protein